MGLKPQMAAAPNGYSSKWLQPQVVLIDAEKAATSPKKAMKKAMKRVPKAADGGVCVGLNPRSV